MTETEMRPLHGEGHTFGRLSGLWGELDVLGMLPENAPSEAPPAPPETPVPPARPALVEEAVQPAVQGDEHTDHKV